MGWAEIFNTHNELSEPFPKKDLDKRILIIDDEVTITDMIEAYLDDYLVMLKRMNWSGKLGIIEQTKEFDKLRAWVHD